MTNSIEELFFVYEKLRIFASLIKIFDLFHSYNVEKCIPKGFNNQEEVLFAQTNLHVINLSFTYSLFDKNGIDIRNLENNELTSEKTKKIICKIQMLWAQLEKSITKFRHNMGFHGGKMKQLKSIIKASRELDTNSQLPDIAILYTLLIDLSKQLENDIKRLT
jgi:hypothetical protein